MRALWAMLMPMLLALPAAAQEVDGEDETVAETKVATGMASYYSREIAGNRTANGEVCDPNALTAAHRSLPFGSKVRVTNLSNGQSVVVRINDRGPFGRGRVIDVSHAAAKEIGMHRSGTARVRLALLDD